MSFEAMKFVERIQRKLRRNVIYSRESFHSQLNVKMVVE